jgi:hypothetical protein
MKKNLLVFLPIIVSVAILLPASLTPNLFSFKPFGWDEVGRLLTFLILIALFLERALEVFIATWRHPRQEELDNSVQSCERKIAELKTQIKTKFQQQVRLSEELKNLENNLEKFDQKRAKHKSRTRKIALWVALFMGLLISGVGIRALETLIVLKEYTLPEKPPFYDEQVRIFHVLDTILTGGLIAGGSDGIHKLTVVFTVFLEETRNQIKDKST